MKKAWRVVLPFAVLLLFIAAAFVVNAFKPEAEKRAEPPSAVITVDVMAVKAQAFSPQIQSFGRIRPRTSTTLLPQVSGQVILVGEQFRDGRFFEKGDLLLRIDPSDYEAQLKISQSNYADTQLALEEEKARAEQALTNWKRINGDAKNAPALVLRKPQVAAAQARVESARAQLDQAKLNLQRTRIIAPYAGRILTAHVDLGQVVSPGMPIADIYATDYLEVRLPIKNHELSFLTLPESYRYTDPSKKTFPTVKIINNLGLSEEVWSAKLVRTEGAMDQASAQLYVIAQIDDPYGPSAQGLRQLKIGQFVSALVSGDVLENALVIPKKTVYQDSYVYLVKDDKLQRREVKLKWQNQDYALLAGGIEENELLVTTPLGLVTSGTAVKISQAAQALDNKAAASNETEAATQ